MAERRFDRDRDFFLIYDDNPEGAEVTGRIDRLGKGKVLAIDIIADYYTDNVVTPMYIKLYPNIGLGTVRMGHTKYTDKVEYVNMKYTSRKNCLTKDKNYVNIRIMTEFMDIEINGKYDEASRRLKTGMFENHICWRKGVEEVVELKRFEVEFYKGKYATQLVKKVPESKIIPI